ncbi:acetyl-CoA carboxylase HFA1 SKDI_13G3370 [Saccharomyces kudriavzevii IFO 1802]|uniref:Biotin carboxylase n=1 Tax=Saccharomyces kudriavzevii (strain ATCC MYA-4449 / AS 2.2408 / CBS 8840 / NBRC 1802 / NCYC 2889) TaxID=226230 RepID=A0AA35J6R7_SACK1|nr:uncharacterized protein SKDI_13G3370 [Saccharomyces kudriavzevii IFO 1802]CAI4048673.1 hypothetical protein SKDI_13G3370 [Saccharomyces kudriavzevii IFO 1802]
MRSIRKWAYETFNDEKIIQFVVMATTDDLHANSEYIRMADQYVQVPGGTNNNNYANIDLILDVAQQTDVDAVWAGWGHASENPCLPELLANSQRKILFIGPPGHAMRSLGDKISSTIVAQSAKIPCIPWSGSGIDTIHTDDQTKLVSVPSDVYSEGCCSSPEDALEKARSIGFPVMIKASEGGGGKGIRQVDNEEDFIAFYGQAVNESPGSPMFVMKVIADARHLEVQLLADQYGTNITLFGRDCSVQRRHQKVIEEAPVTITKPEIFHKMERAAIRLGELVGYVSAGTVEYLYSPEDDKFYFLELNPRLQVEHPTTEMISGVNLPAAQLQIAMGIPMHRISDIRKLYDSEPTGTSRIDFKCSKIPSPKGHCISCRITSEDPNEGFKPSTGKIHELNFRSSSDVWGYFSVGNNGAIHSFSDSQFGHIFAIGNDRRDAKQNMVLALKDFSIRGEFKTPVEYLIELLETQDFGNNRISTGWLDSLILKNLPSDAKLDPILAVICGAAMKAYIFKEEIRNNYLELLQRGQVPPKDLLRTKFSIDFIFNNQRYLFTAVQSSEERFLLSINNSQCEVNIQKLSSDCLLISVDGKCHTIYWKEDVRGTRLSIDSVTTFLEAELNPTQMISPTPGKLMKYSVSNGDHISAGQQYAEIEIMKMQMPLVAKANGVVELLRQPGSIIEAGDVVANLSLDAPSKANELSLYQGELPTLSPPIIEGSRPVHKFRTLLGKLENILKGYNEVAEIGTTLKELIKVLRDGRLPYSEWRSQISTVHNRLPKQLSGKLEKLIENSASFPARKLHDFMARYVDENMNDHVTCISLEPLLNIAKRYYEGLTSHEHEVFFKLIKRYHDIEKIFESPDVDEERNLLDLRNKDLSNLKDVLCTSLSHANIRRKNKLIISILQEYEALCQDSSSISLKFGAVLHDLATLVSKLTKEVAIKARTMLLGGYLPSLRQRKEYIENLLRLHSDDIGGKPSWDRNTYSCMKDFDNLIRSNLVQLQDLFFFFGHQNVLFSKIASEIYVRYAYGPYELEGMNNHKETPDILMSWRFSSSKDILPSSNTYIDEDMNFSELSLTYNENRSKNLAFLVNVDGLDSMENTLDAIYENIKVPQDISADGDNFLIVNVLSSISHKNEEDLIKSLRNKLLINCKRLADLSASRVTFAFTPENGPFVKFYSFNGAAYDENFQARNLDPSYESPLELERMANYKIRPLPTYDSSVRIFEGISKFTPLDRRFFIRKIINSSIIDDRKTALAHLKTGINAQMHCMLDHMEAIDSSNSDLNHIFLNFNAVFNVSARRFEEVLESVLETHETRLFQERITDIEIRIFIEGPEAKKPVPLRLLISNKSGYVIKIKAYYETIDKDGNLVLKSPGKQGHSDQKFASLPYSVKDWLQPKRYKAQFMGTTYVYDFPDLFQQAAIQQWKKYFPKHKLKEGFFTWVELIERNGSLIKVNRGLGHNNIGMVAFEMMIQTPEYPEGRNIIVISNDITYNIGSFGPKEDFFFDKVTNYAREKGIPRIYLAANSGAKLGIAEELIPLFHVAWNDPSDPAKGFRYLYLTPKDMQQLRDSGKENSVVTEHRMVYGEERYIIKTIVGSEEGIGVECLQGSGLIAGATSKAYKDIFTITAVTCRSVGIGSYLVRLGQRTIQVEDKPIILTGVSAINRVLGKDIYSSNLQIGGTQIMYKNGITHLTVSNDMKAVEQILTWLSYVPAKRGMSAPVLETIDRWDRNVSFKPVRQVPYEAKWLIEGKLDANGEFQSGLFDRGSFFETLSGWAKGVVVGRARLGGIPVGVIAVETKTIEDIVPADPADPKSSEFSIKEAGQVWYPNSAFKTAQSINDFNYGEQLPLIILANWRGFSGGQRDMYNEVLKYGSFIVDALVEYKQPIIIYIPPLGELRGGSWVVVDPTINPEQMEMYADLESRGGVLEPDGVVSIKYRKEKMIETMTRLDSTYRHLKRTLMEKELSLEKQSDLTKRLKIRERQLMPIYSQISIQFADLHDRSTRMLVKGVIRKELEWKKSRRFLYWRLRRRLNEGQVIKRLRRKMSDNKTVMEYGELLKMVQTWYDHLDVSDDRAVAEFIERNSKEIDKNVEEFEISLFIDELKKRFEDKNGNIVLEELTKLVDSKRKK